MDQDLRPIGDSRLIMYSSEHVINEKGVTYWSIGPVICVCVTATVTKCIVGQTHER